MQRFVELPVINKLLGAKKSIGNPENDYLRILWQNGILGFLSYITLLCLTGYFLISRYVVTKEVVILVGILVFTVFLMNGIGSYSMRYPNLQWFIWGIMGFVLSKDQIGENDA
jgi:O-antigen ligase